MRTTAVEACSALAKTKDIQGLLSRLELFAHFIDIADQAHVGFDEGEFAVGVEDVAFLRDAVAGTLRAAYEVNSGLESVLREGLESRFTDAIGCANEDSDEVGREGRGDESVGGLDRGEENHGCI